MNPDHMAGSKRRSPATWVGLAFAAALLVSCTSASPTTPSPTIPPIAIRVDGAAREVPLGTTLGQLARQLSLRPTSGRLLSVTGNVLQRGAEPGRVLVNGRVVTREAPLSSGDSIRVVDGTDQTEPTRLESKTLPGKHFGDPQRSLDRWRIKQITTIGKISGEVASIDLLPVGKPDVPREVALTFDDGPWPKYTREIVRVLRRYHATASFFMIGRNVARWPRIAQDVVQAGMVVGNHSWDHPLTPPFSDLIPNRLQMELSLTNQALASVGVQDPYLFRPPGGSYDEDVVQEARRQGMRLVNWDVDPKDWESTRSAQEIAHAVLADAGPGSIVDMHDGGGNQQATVRALPIIIKGLRKRHLDIVAIPR